MAISPATNTPANVDNWYFLGGAAPRWNLPRTLKSRRALATAKFPGEIYRAACTGKCRGPVARFVAKIFATAFSMFSSRDACVRAWYWRLMRASTRVDTRDTHKHTYTNMCIYVLSPWRWRATLLPGFISIVFQTNKRERSHLLLLSIPLVAMSR